MTIEQYLDKINLAYLRGNATEHTYRTYLKELIESLAQDIIATNEPKRQKCGAPDYILTRKDIPVGFIEAKDIGDNDLKGEKLKGGNKEQFDRYKASLDNIIFTDYLDFYLYRDGVLVAQVRIGEVTNQGIKPLSINFSNFTNLLKDFCTHIGQTITNSQKLAQMMAGKARLMAEVIERAILADQENEEISSLVEQMQAFKEILIHDIVPKSFADVYAQTIVYGMFAARLHDADLNNFSRQKAYDLIPKSNPFLKKLFGYIAGLEVDDRIRWIVDSLSEVFLACDVQELLQDYGKNTQTEDAIIHFYETFLSEYDANLRKTRGVWYTPAPVVNFIVRAVDDILKTEFDLPKGLTDNSKTNVKIKLHDQDKRYKKDRLSEDKTKKADAFLETEVHKVQILDPATGTGTFLAEVIKHIYQQFKGQEGIWSSYVEQDLLPRLNGFELLMASYAMAHLQLDLLLKSTGYLPTQAGLQRLRVYLTNSLEEPQEAQYKFAMAQWLSEEGNEANKIKRETPVMCIIGNPPYSGESQNKSDWIMHLMEDYKKEPDNKGKLQEKNPKWINDDYVKFLRYGQYFIEKNGSGVLAFINPHGFLDNPTFRGMRYNLLQTYDKIYTIDLHGNSKKKEKTPDGSPDRNVFDIMQGVSINLFVKTGKKKAEELGKVFHFDLFGKREMKYDFLLKNSFKTVPYQELPNVSPNYYFVPKDFKEFDAYNEGFSLSSLFPINSVGIVTANDNLYIAFDKKTLKKQILEKYEKVDDSIVRPIAYRPFDTRFLYNNVDMIERSRIKVMQHFLVGENVGLTFKLGNAEDKSVPVMTSNKIIEFRSWSRSGMQGGDYVAPLYLYPEAENGQKNKKKSLLTAIDKEALRYKLIQAKEHYEQISKFFYKTVLPFYEAIENPSIENTKLFEENRSIYEEAKASVEKIETQLNSTYTPQNETKSSILTERLPNLNKEIIAQIAEGVGLTFTPEKEATEGTFSPIDLLDYIYAVLHSPTYRETYQEFLKIDFPRVPYPNPLTFWELVCLGGKLRQIHLLESEALENYITQYPISGTNTVGKLKYEAGKVWINDTQYFEGVPQIAWDFYIGGYQPAQKWLKDRKDRSLDFDDILHYQKIIVALVETDSMMKEIDKIKIE